MPNTRMPDREAETAFRTWLHAAHNPAFSRRTAGVNAAFFLPHLKPGMRLLDAGCGPGSITAGLAAAVAPGQAIGVDSNPDRVEAAQALVTAGTPNLSFEVADIQHLPFDDQSFDAVFIHAVLQHLPDATSVLRKARRVLKRGGVIGVADADFGGSVIWPAPAALRRAIRLMVRVRRVSGGDMFVGRKLRQCLADAGFAEITGSAAAGADGSAEGTRLTGESWARYYSSSDFVAHAVAAGLASEQELREAAAAWREWGSGTGSYWARFWCQAVAVNPG